MVTEATLITRDIELTAQGLQELLLDAIGETPFATPVAYQAMALVAQAFTIDRDDLRARHTSDGHLTGEASDAIVDDLAAAGMLAVNDDRSLTLAPEGMRVFGEVRERLTAASVEIHGGIAQEDLMVTRRTLTAIRTATERVRAGGLPAG